MVISWTLNTQTQKDKLSKLNICNMAEKNIYVSNEIGRLRKLMVHSPDGGIGKIIPSKFDDWLYDDTVELGKMREEYDQYITLLLYFLDPEQIKKIEAWQKKNPNNKRDIFMPNKKAYFESEKVIEVQKILAKVLKNKNLKERLVSAICAMEGCPFPIEQKLNNLNPGDLSKTLITGIFKLDTEEEKYIFPPVPNLVFTRDIGITVKDHILLSKLAKQPRKRESLLIKYICYFELFKDDMEKVIEVSEDSDFFLETEENKKKKVVSIEGGDVMMIAPNHLLVGNSERTSAAAADAIVHKLFSLKDLGIEYVTVVKIKKDRAQMHIDTIFTQVSRAHWVLHPKFSEKVTEENDKIKKDYGDYLRTGKMQVDHKEIEIIQFYKKKSEKYKPSKNYLNTRKSAPQGIEELFTQISGSFGVKKKDVKIVYSGGGKFPYAAREQWTDSCNVVAVKEGVVIGYDRNIKTAQAFEQVLGYRVIKSSDLIREFEEGKITPDKVEKTLILLPSSELSRARGGSHCMSMPLLRDEISKKK